MNQVTHDCIRWQAVPVDSTKQWYSMEYKKFFLHLRGGRMLLRPLNGEHELQVLDNKSLQENIWM
jgi:hypothetical protein